MQRSAVLRDIRVLPGGEGAGREGVEEEHANGLLPVMFVLEAANENANHLNAVPV